MKKIILTILVFLIVISTSLGDLTAASSSTSWNDTLFPLRDRGDTNNIDTVIDNLSDVKNEVTGSGNVKQAANDFREQLNYRALGNAESLREVIRENVIWFQGRETKFKLFAGPIGNRCHSMTACYQFRLELSQFIKDIVSQKNNFEIIDKLNLDGSNAEDVIMKVPPMMLFGVHEALNNMPDWKNLPNELQNIFDEIGDREVFSVRLNENEQNTSASRFSSMAMSSDRKTPTQRFCERWEPRIDREMDQVRLKRIQNYVGYFVKIIELFESGVADNVGVSIVGEGTDVFPNPLQIQLKGVLLIIEVIQDQVNDFRDNLNSCRNSRREIELQVAQCLPLADFVMPSKRDEVYMIVKTKVQNAADENLSVSLSEASLTKAETFRNQGKYKQAYFKICDAYSQIGS